MERTIWQDKMTGEKAVCEGQTALADAQKKTLVVLVQILCWIWEA